MDTDNHSSHGKPGSMTMTPPPGRTQGQQELLELLEHQLQQHSPDRQQELLELLRLQRIAELKAELSAWPAIDRGEILDFLNSMMLEELAADLDLGELTAADLDFGTAELDLGTALNLFTGEPEHD
ncbi:MAG: hypothetical protein ACOVOX_06170 [Burkholderiaceae bacterium]